MLSKPQLHDIVAKKPDYLKLSALIDQFNETEDLSLKLAFLQQIDMYSKAVVENCEEEFLEKKRIVRLQVLADAVYSWRNQEIYLPTEKSAPTDNSQPREQTLTEVLQHFGIHRDAPILLKSTEFALAYRRLKNAHEDSKESEESNTGDFNQSYDLLYSLLKDRYLTLKQILRNEFKDKSREELYQHLETIHIKLFEVVNNSPQIQESVREHLDMLALSQAQIELLMDKVEQQFDNYQLAQLQKESVNNDNSLFTILKEKDQDIKLVVRIEDRDNSAHEQWLQSNKVTRFFVKDYVNLTKQYDNDGVYVYRPVVISQYAAHGNLEEEAQRIAMKQPGAIAEAAQNYFTQISQFCLELKELNFYHTDIKLTNFLLENGNVVVSDRKGFLNERNAKVPAIRTSPLYAPPEFLKFLNNNSRSVTSRATNKTLDLLPFMSFQVGMALKSFLAGGESYNIAHVDLLKNKLNTGLTYTNLAILSDALTRQIPEDRITLDLFHSMLTTEQLNLPTEQFLAELEQKATVYPFAASRAIKALMQTTETIEESSLEGLLFPFEELALLDHDVEALLLELFKTKPVSSISYAEFSLKIQTIKDLASSNSTEESHINTLYKVVKESNVFLTTIPVNQKSSTAAKLLAKTIKSNEKKYEFYFDTIHIRSLVEKFQNRTITSSELQQTSTYLKKYLNSNFDNKPSRVKKSFMALQKASVAYITKEVTTYNVKQAGLFERLLAWLRIRPLPNRVTRTDIENNPDSLLNLLSQDLIKNLFAKQPELTRVIIPLYEQPQDSYTKLEKLKKAPVASPATKKDEKAEKVIITDDEDFVEEYDDVIIKEDTDTERSKSARKDKSTSEDTTEEGNFDDVIIREDSELDLQSESGSVPLKNSMNSM